MIPIGRLKELLAESPGVILSKRAYLGLTWEQWFAFAGSAEHLDFGCGFRNEGCINVKNFVCCGGCASGRGHFRLLPDDENIWKEIAKYFIQRSGFRGAYGCRLPHRLRSPVCLRFVCASAFQNLTAKARRFREILIDKNREAALQWIG